MASRQVVDVPLQRGCRGFTLRSRHGGQMAWQAGRDPNRTWCLRLFQLIKSALRSLPRSGGSSTLSRDGGLQSKIEGPAHRAWIAGTAMFSQSHAGKLAMLIHRTLLLAVVLAPGALPALAAGGGFCGLVDIG